MCIFPYFAAAKLGNRGFYRNRNKLLNLSGWHSGFSEFNFKRAKLGYKKRQASFCDACPYTLDKVSITSCFLQV